MNDCITAKILSIVFIIICLIESITLVNLLGPGSCNYRAVSAIEKCEKNLPRNKYCITEIKGIIKNESKHIKRKN